MVKDIPVLLNFDTQEPIGYLRVDTDKLPQIPNYHFGLGYINSGPNGEHDVVCVAVILDALHKKYEHET